jgi:dipeptidyl aminopeptidase/acylaminoacyl peptidase
MLNGVVGKSAWKCLRHLAIAVMTSACGRGAPAEQIRTENLQPVLIARSAAEVEFSQITDMAVDSRAQIYVGDRLGEIIVLGNDGKVVRRFGRMGDGPGEFLAVGTLSILKDDSLYVYDGYAQRVTVYAPNSGHVAYTVRVPQPGYSFPMDVKPHGAGTLIGHFRRINGDVPIAGQRSDDVIRILGPDGSVLKDTVLTMREPDALHVRTETNEGFYFPEFARQSLVRWGPDGLIYSLWTDSARVHVHDTAGRVRGSFVADLGAPRLALAAATVDSVAEVNAQPGTPKRTLVDAFSGRWKTWPLVQDMLVDDQSRVWILPVTHAPQVSWVAFDARGRRLATLQLPRSVRPRLIRGDRLYAVSRDSLDVETLAVYRLQPSSTRTPKGS